MKVYNNVVFTGALLEAVEGIVIARLLGEAAVVYLPTCFFAQCYYRTRICPNWGLGSREDARFVNEGGGSDGEVP